MSAKVGVTPAVRLVRGVVCAALATFLAGASHAVAGGMIPIHAVLLAFPLGSLVCVMLAGRQLSLFRVVVGVSASQVVFHLLFTFFAVMPVTVSSQPGHEHEGMLTAALLPVAPGTGSSVGVMDTSMMSSHLVAGFVTVALVRQGEQLWWSLIGILDAVVTHVVRLVRLCPVTDERYRAADEHAPFGLYELLQGDTRLQLRGPPAVRVSLS